jgi:hypothetical protein
VYHRRLAVSVVSAFRKTGVPKGLSRMRGNSYVQFLEGWAGAIPSGHSTRSWFAVPTRRVEKPHFSYNNCYDICSTRRHDSGRVSPCYPQSSCLVFEHVWV